MSSKFSTPFMNKSPLHGAYTSGAGGMVYASNRDIFQKLQDDITSAVDKGLGGKSSCDDPNTFSYMEGTTRKRCPEKGTTFFADKLKEIESNTSTGYRIPVDAGKIKI